MSEKTDEQKLRERVAAAVRYDLYVIIKRGQYYRPNANGYTSSLVEAWKLPKSEAKKYEMYADRKNVPNCEKALTRPAPIPDYPNSLDTIAEAARGLTGGQTARFQYELDEIARRQKTVICLLTARDWCEAFLAVVEDGKDKL